ncbi:uncharacterized protein [Pithys albifrons albifrons]|uniref:uncharacterized protein n=1 Tax=Pithys albifrons albifrons TaxID=3385563 RepID=UPI003A5CCB16
MTCPPIVFRAELSHPPRSAEEPGQGQTGPGRIGQSRPGAPGAPPAAAPAAPAPPLPGRPWRWVGPRGLCCCCREPRKLRAGPGSALRGRRDPSPRTITGKSDSPSHPSEQLHPRQWLFVAPAAAVTHGQQLRAWRDTSPPPCRALLLLQRGQTPRYPGSQCPGGRDRALTTICASPAVPRKGPGPHWLWALLGAGGIGSLVLVGIVVWLLQGQGEDGTYRALKRSLLSHSQGLEPSLWKAIQW